MIILPPYAALLGVTVDHGSGDAPQFLMPASDNVLGRPGYLHGGAMAGLLEMAAVGALQASLAADGAEARIKPINVTVDYMRGGKMIDTHAIGIVHRVGRRVANVEALCWQDDRGAPIAAARINFLIRRDAQKD